MRLNRSMISRERKITSDLKKITAKHLKIANTLLQLKKERARIKELRKQSYRTARSAAEMQIPPAPIPHMHEIAEKESVSVNQI